MWRSVLSIPSPRGLAHSTRDRLLRKLADADNMPIPTIFFPLSRSVLSSLFSHCSALPVLIPLLRCLSILFCPLFLSCAVRHPSTIGPILPVLLYSCRVFPPALLFCLLLSSLFSHFSALPALHLLLSCFLSLSHHPYCLVLSYFCPVFFLCWRALLVAYALASS